MLRIILTRQDGRVMQNSYHIGGGACITDDLTQSRIILSNRAKYLIKIGLQINLLIVC